MRRKKAQPLGPIIREVMEGMKARNKRLEDADLALFWKEMMGATISQAATRIYFRQRKMYIHLNSSVIRNELQMHREKMIEAINNKAGFKRIDNIVLR